MSSTQLVESVDPKESVDTGRGDMRRKQKQQCSDPARSISLRSGCTQPGEVKGRHRCCWLLLPFSCPEQFLAEIAAGYQHVRHGVHRSRADICGAALWMCAA